MIKTIKLFFAIFIAAVTALTTVAKLLFLLRENDFLMTTNELFFIICFFILVACVAFQFRQTILLVRENKDLQKQVSMLSSEKEEALEIALKYKQKLPQPPKTPMEVLKRTLNPSDTNPASTHNE